MDKKAYGIFEEINRIFKGTAKIPKEEIRYFDKEMKFYQTYCNSLMREKRYER